MPLLDDKYKRSRETISTTAEDKAKEQIDRGFKSIENKVRTKKKVASRTNSSLNLIWFREKNCC